jgi:F-type H+-transporting ATPase subunit a
MPDKKIDPFEHVVDSSHVEFFGGLELQGLTYGTHGTPLKFIIFITLAAITVAVAMIWLGRKMKNGDPPKGKLWNLIESLLFFVRDKMAVPGIGEHDANKYLPYLTSLFLFIFAMNLMGLIPFLGSPTASIMVTGALALVSFVVIHTSGVMDLGGKAYLKSFIPHIHIEGGAVMQFLGKMIMVGIAAMEYVTAFIRAIVLAIRLFANMLAGHTVLFMILFFVALVSNPLYQVDFVKQQGEGVQNVIWGATSLFSIGLVTALSLLELFIAGLQAFIFTFLTAVYIGLAKHPPH